MPAPLLANGVFGPPLSSYPDIFSDVSSLAMPENIPLALRWCLPPGSLIEMGDLSFKPVETVTPGDKVLTKGGTIEAVVCSGKREVKEALVSICATGLGKKDPIVLTSNHKLFVLPN